MITDPRCDLKLFIENTSCSVMSANVNTAVRLTATIEVLPTKEVRNLKPMTNIVLGYRDPAGKTPELVDQEGVTYSVLFIGMLSSISITKSGTSRSATLNCVGHQALLDRHYTYVSNVATQSFSHKKDFVGASKFLRVELGAGGLSQQVAAVFKDQAPPFTPGLGSLTGPPRGSIKLIEKCIGVTLPAGSRKEGEVHGAQHEFFAHASHQCRLLFQIDGVSVDEGLNEIIDKDSTGKILSASSSQMADHTDLSTMLDILLRQMYYGISPIGTPRTFVSSDTEVVQRGNILTSLREKYTSAVVEAGSTIPDTIGTPIVIDIKSATELVYKDLSKGDNRDGGAISKLTKLLNKDIAKVFPNLSEDINRLVPKTKITSLIDSCVPYVAELLKLKDAATVLSEKDADTVTRTTAAILRNVAAISKVESGDTGNKFCRVVSYFVMPNLTFCTPPTCNVIFPNQISTFSYNKESFNMPTRLLLHSEAVANATEQQGGVSGYYAPSSHAFAESQGGFGRKDEEIPLLNHEKFTGIVPSFASISFYDKFKTMGNNTEETMLRIANFNLMLQRYQRNGITCNGPFNPFAAVGFPIAFVDVDDINAENPSLYVGMLTSLTHSYVGAGSATTSYTVQHVREVGDVDEIFGDAVLRSTNASSASALVLREDESSTSLGPVEVGLTSLLETINTVPIFLSTYDFNVFNEVTVSGSTTSVRKPCQAASILSALEKALPSELSGNSIIASEWSGLEAYPPPLVLNNLTSRIATPAYILRKIKEEPYVNNIQLAAKMALTSLEKYFTSSDDTLVGTLKHLATNKDLDSEFTNDLLIRVIPSLGSSLFELIQRKFTVSLIEGIQDPKKEFSLPKSFEVSWWALMPIDSKRMLGMIKEGKVDFFDRTYLFPENAHKSVSVYLAGSTNEDAEATAAEKIAVEELYRPPWFSDIFSIAKIGKDVYSHVLGCGSVQDVVSPNTPKDTSANTNEGTALTYTTKLSLLESYRGYMAAPSQSKSEFVNGFVRRPIANVLDVLGNYGLLTTEIADAAVVDLQQICNKTKVRDLSKTDATTKSLTFDPNELVLEKRENVMLYVNSTRGDAFR